MWIDLKLSKHPLFKECSNTDKLIYILILQFKNESGETSLPTKELCEFANVSRQSIQNSLRILRENGFITSKLHDFWMTNLYEAEPMNTYLEKYPIASCFDVPRDVDPPCTEVLDDENFTFLGATHSISKLLPAQQKTIKTNPKIFFQRLYFNASRKKMNMPYDKNMLIPVSAARVDDNFMDAEKCFLHIRDHLRNK